jgi:predicted Zn-dependent peptidase
VTRAPTPCRVHAHTLANGVRVLVAPMPARARTHLYVHLHGGPVYEDDKTWGLSHLLEHMVFRGSGRHKDVVGVTRAADDFGGDVGAATYRDRVSFDTRLDADRVNDAFDLVSGILRAPRFSSMRIERAIVAEEIAELVDDDGNQLDAENAVFSRVFPGERLARTIEGIPEQVGRYRESDVRAFHARAYAGRSTVVSVAGPVDAARVIAAAQKTFGRIAEGTALSLGAAPRAPRRTGVELIRLDAAQTTVRVAFRAPGRSSKEARALSVLARILDDGPASRLQQSLVDEQGLAYSVWAFSDPYEEGSVLELGGTVRHDRVGALLRALVRELRVLVKGGVTHGEVRRVAARHARDMREVLDDPAALAEHLGRHALFGARFDPRAAPDELSSVTAREVSALARELLTRDAARLILAGDPTRREVSAARAAVRGLPSPRR